MIASKCTHVEKEEAAKKQMLHFLKIISIVIRGIFVTVT